MLTYSLPRTFRSPAAIFRVAAFLFLAILVVISLQSRKFYPTYNKQVLVGKVTKPNDIAYKTGHSLCEKISRSYTFEDGQSVFEKFNNVTGADCFIVPNIIHFVRFGKTEYSFTDYVVILAAWRHHGPAWFYIHTDVPQFTGKYWQKLMGDPEISKRIVIKHLEVPSEIFGQKLSTGWRLWHGSDVARLRVMMEYGGIYLDNDVFVIQNLDKYRKYELAINWDENQFLGSQVVIANKDARFLSLWLDTYREYHADKWYYNAGERPTVEVLYKQPELVHRVKGGFGADTGVSMRLYTDKSNTEWRSLDTIHLLLGHRSYYPNYKKTPTFDENNIKTYEYPFGDMVRELLNEFS